MPKMTKEKWRRMTAKEQTEYLLKQPVEFIEQQFMNGKKKVGDYSAFCKKYQAVIGGIVMSGWKDSKEEARAHAAEIFDVFAEEANDE